MVPPRARRQLPARAAGGGPDQNVVMGMFSVAKLPTPKSKSTLPARKQCMGQVG